MPSCSVGIAQRKAQPAQNCISVMASCSVGIAQRKAQPAKIFIKMQGRACHEMVHPL